MRRIAIALAVVATLTACGSGVGDIGESSTGGVEVPMPDGRTIPCVIYKDNYAGGLSCDWSGTR